MLKANQHTTVGPKWAWPHVRPEANCVGSFLALCMGTVLILPGTLRNLNLISTCVFRMIQCPPTKAVVPKLSRRLEYLWGCKYCCKFGGVPLNHERNPRVLPAPEDVSSSALRKASTMRSLLHHHASPISCNNT